MQVTAEQTDPCTIVLDIEVDEQQVARTFDSVFREFGRHANVPGFRPGKAPRPILERFLNLEKVRERALEKLIQDSYFKAIEEESITPYRQPRIEPTDLEDKKPYTFKAVVPLEPQVTLGAYTGLTVEKPVYKVTDEDIANQIDRLREGRARLERVTDRGVQAGDILIAENKVVLEGEVNDEPPRRQLIQLGNNIPGFDEQLLGMEPGDERQFDLTFPEDFDEEEKRGKKASYTVKLSSISAKRIPDLDDELAKQVGGGETVEELKTAVREREEKSVAEASDQIAESRLIQQIVSQSTIFFPEALVLEEVEDDLRQLSAELRQRQIRYEEYLDQIKLTREQHIEALKGQAAARIQSVLALRKIAVQEGFEVSDEQVDAEFDRLLDDGQITDDQYDEFKADNRRRLQIANALTQQRLHDYLFANNTINEVEQKAALDPEAEGEAEAEIPAQS